MLPIRMRWPLLAAFFTGLGYLGQHFTISGLEHLQLKARSQQSAASNESRLAVSAWDWGAAGQGLPSTSPGQSAAALPPSSWQHNLSIGEKIAIWQSGQRPDVPGGQSAAGIPLPSTAQWPVSTPIPLPPGFSDGSSSSNANPAGNLVPVSPGQAMARLPGTSQAGPGKMAASNKAGLALPPARAGEDAARSSVIRIGSFNLQDFGPGKLVQPRVLDTLVSVLQQYDVTALQEIQSSRDDILPLIMDRLNQSGRRYDYLIGPRVGRVAPHQQFAFVFDTERVETDRFQLYTVDDPDDVLAYEPLVAWFRCRNAPEDQAFTFSLVNLRIDPTLGQAERDMLPQLLDALRADGRGEDDIILAGDLNAGTSSLAMLQNQVRFAIQDMPTNVEGTQMLDNIFFVASATPEFTGRAGVTDFLRDRNLSIEAALELSDHMPVWAEFSVFEGAEPGRVAPLTSSSVF